MILFKTYVVRTQTGLNCHYQESNQVIDQMAANDIFYYITEI